MRTLSLVVHTSLDGYVADVNGELSGFEPGEENLEFVVELTKTADAALLGRVSYELLNQYWPSAKDNPDATKGEIAYSEWYNAAEKVVFSKTMADEEPANTTVVGDEMEERVIDLKRQPGKTMLIFGSPSVARQLMEADLIDEYWIFVNPVIFGEGIPLFKPTQKSPKLRLISTRQFQNGEIALRYQLLRP